jgi:hypothetical protein
MSRFAISFTALGLFTVPLSAAPVPVGPKPADEPISYTTAKLLQHRKVQKELKMTAEQRINLHDALEDIEEDFEKQIEALDKLPNAPDDAFEKIERNRQKMIRSALIKTAEKELTATQKQRLRQVDRQFRGPAAFASADVQKALQLTDPQKKAAQELLERTNAVIERYLNSLDNDDEAKAKVEARDFRKEAAAKFVEQLTADQQTTWKKLLGEPTTGLDVEELWFRVIAADDEEPTEQP